LVKLEVNEQAIIRAVEMVGMVEEVQITVCPRAKGSVDTHPYFPRPEIELFCYSFEDPFPENFWRRCQVSRVLRGFLFYGPLLLRIPCILFFVVLAPVSLWRSFLR